VTLRPWEQQAAGAIIGLYRRRAGEFAEARDQSLAVERDWLARFRALLPPGGAVLDCGCGFGQPMAAHLLAHGHPVTGVDSSPGLLARAAQALPAGEWLLADMRGLALGRRFAGILAWNSFFHLAPGDQRAMVATFAAHAAPGAALMFTSGPRGGVQMGAYLGEMLYHASLEPAEYRALLAGHGVAVRAFVPDDPAAGRHSVWLAQREG
jgi:trans-aconitate methyltransferase